MSIAKQANSPNAEFEQAFFQLAFERLQDKLFNLIDYLVGFNIINKSDDGTKAVGVFGFKADNGQILFVPAFFKDGDVKGIDIMYSKNNEQFYPLNEDFAELFLKDDPSGIGSVTEETIQQINQHTPAVDMRDLVRPPRTGKVSYASVLDYVEQAGNETKDAFQHFLEKDAHYLESVLRFYDIEKVAKALVRKKEADKVLPVPSVQVLSSSDDLSKLSDKEKAKIFSDGYVVVDKRKKEQKSQFGIEKFEEKFTNPSESGFYPYVTQSGSIRYAIIIVDPISLDPRFNSDESIIVELSDGYTYGTTRNNIYTKGQIVVKDIENALSGLKDPAEVKPSYSDKYILVNSSLKATRPFTVAANYKNDEGLRCIVVETSGALADYCDEEPRRPRKFSNSYFADKNQSPFYRKYTIIMTKKPGDKLSFDNNTIYVPKGFKLLPLTTYPTGGCCSTESGSYEERESARQKARQKYEAGKPATKSNILGALKYNRVFPMTVTSNGSEYFVSVKDVKKKYDTALKAKTAMIVDLGLDEETADSIMSKVANQISQSGYIKMAYTGDNAPAPWDPVPYTNELGQPTYDGVGNMEVAPIDQTYTNDPTRIGLGTTPGVEGVDAAISHANELAEAGQKEVFDTQSIATLAKYVSPETKVVDYMPDFISCLDKLGRMLFLVYWETDKFEQMYGRSELPEMTELLTNVFRNLGDLIIFLKRKAPQLSINMSETATGI